MECIGGQMVRRRRWQEPSGQGESGQNPGLKRQSTLLKKATILTNEHHCQTVLSSEVLFYYFFFFVLKTNMQACCRWLEQHSGRAIEYIYISCRSIEKRELGKLIESSWIEATMVSFVLGMLCTMYVVYDCVLLS